MKKGEGGINTDAPRFLLPVNVLPKNIEFCNRPPVTRSRTVCDRYSDILSGLRSGWNQNHFSPKANVYIIKSDLRVIDSIRRDFDFISAGIITSVMDHFDFVKVFALTKVYCNTLSRCLTCSSTPSGTAVPINHIPNRIIWITGGVCCQNSPICAIKCNIRIICAAIGTSRYSID